MQLTDRPGAWQGGGRVKRKTEPKRRQPTPRCLAVVHNPYRAKQHNVRKGDRVQVKFESTGAPRLHIGTVTKVGLSRGRFKAEFPRTWAAEESHTIDPVSQQHSTAQLCRAL